MFYVQVFAKYLTFAGVGLQNAQQFEVEFLILIYILGFNILMLICCKRWYFKTFLSQFSGPNILGLRGSGSCKRERSYVLPYKEQNVRMRRKKSYYNVNLQIPPHCTGLKKVVKYLHHGAGHPNELLLITH